MLRIVQTRAIAPDGIAWCVCFCVRVVVTTHAHQSSKLAESTEMQKISADVVAAHSEKESFSGYFSAAFSIATSTERHCCSGK